MESTHGPRSLHDRWALITGAGKRIGAAIARDLHAAGANVVVHHFRSATEAHALVAELNLSRPGSAFTLQADLRDTQRLPGMMAGLIERSARLDILVNNASTFYPTPLASVSEAQWDDLIGSNLKAPLFLTQAALPYLQRSQGSVVNIVDVHWQRPLRDHPVYGAAKAGLAMLTRSLARDLGPAVRVNGISPGAILWPESGTSETVQKKILNQTALRRAGEPGDIAAAVVFLVRDAPYVTGQILAVDGGRSIGW